MKGLYATLAGLVNAAANCVRTNNTEWHWKHTERAEQLVRDHLPSGSGWDHGTKIDWAKSTGEKLVFVGAFHHMDEHGYYDGWTEHTVTVRASLQFGLDITISGRNRNMVKEYLHDLFHTADSVYREQQTKATA